MKDYEKFFPKKKWEEMNGFEKDFFRNLKPKDLINRWQSKIGKQIKEQIINCNKNYKKSSSYLDFIGTVKTDWSNKDPKIDLRGVDFSGFKNIINNEVFSFDFSNCALHYSSFSNTDIRVSLFKQSDILYSDFTSSTLDECDFSFSNLTLTNFSKSSLCYANFKNCWMSDVNFLNARLSFIKFNNKTDFHDIDVSKLNGSSDFHFSRYLVRKSNLYYFK